MSGLELLGAASAILGLVGLAYTITTRTLGVYTNPEVDLFSQEVRSFTAIWPALERILEDRHQDLEPETLAMVQRCQEDTTQALEETRAELEKFVTSYERNIMRSLKSASTFRWFGKKNKDDPGHEFTHSRWRAFFQQDRIRRNRERLQTSQRYLTLVLHVVK
jgi:hypothetical protein